MARQKDEYTRAWIIDNSLEIIPQYERGVLTLRGLFYQLVALGMTNTNNHYKRVVAAMKAARLDDLVAFDSFSDHDREAIGWTAAAVTDLEFSIKYAKEQIEAWIGSYSKNRWENQEKYIEVWIEKKALQGVFQSVCSKYDVALCPCNCLLYTSPSPRDRG